MNNGTDSSLADSDTSVSEQETEIPSDNTSQEVDPFDKAIRDAIVSENNGKYLPGECYGVGYEIMETFENDNTISVYALTEYVEYGFQDNVFVNISGTNPKVLMCFSENNGVYDCIFYTRLDLFSDLPEDEIKKLLEPLESTGKHYLYTDEDLQKVRAQADECAVAYLESINRNAEVAIRDEHKGKQLLELVSNTDLLMQLLKDEEFCLYPEWTGTTERLENGIRYIYQTEFDPIAQEIIYIKKLYDTNEVIARTVVPTTEAESF